MSLPQEMPIGPPKRRRKRTPKKDLEGTVIRECLRALRACSAVVYVERRNTGAVLFQGGGFVRFGHVGAADIWCLVKLPGYRARKDRDGFPLQQRGILYQHVEIECKRADGKGRQSPNQKRFQELCDSCGIPYILTTSAQELMTKIDEISSCWNH